MAYGFDEQWLSDYQARQAGTKPPLAASVVTEDTICFTLAKPFALQNVWTRWLRDERTRWQYAAYQKDLANEIRMLLPWVPNRKPFQKASVFIQRLSIGTPDLDGCVGGVKPLCDVLVMRSDTHKHGIGLIVNDDPAHLELTVEAVKVRRAEERTIVLITRLK